MEASIPTSLFVKAHPLATRNSQGAGGDTRKESPSDKQDISLDLEQEPRLRGKNGGRPEPTYEKQNMNLMANVVGERASNTRWEDVSVLFAAALFGAGAAVYNATGHARNTFIEAGNFVGYLTAARPVAQTGLLP